MKQPEIASICRSKAARLLTGIDGDHRGVVFGSMKMAPVSLSPTYASIWSDVLPQ
jgi:hypothetical protein